MSMNNFHYCKKFDEVLRTQNRIQNKIKKFQSSRLNNKNQVYELRKEIDYLKNENKSLNEKISDIKISSQNTIDKIKVDNTLEKDSLLNKLKNNVDRSELESKVKLTLEKTINELKKK